MFSITRLIEKIQDGKLKSLNLAEYIRKPCLFNDQTNNSDIRDLQSLFIYLNQHNEKLNQIGYIDLSSNNLTEIPPFIFSLGKLSELNLFRNHIKQLPAQLSRLKYLSILELGENELEAFPQIIYQLPNLTHLSLYRNRIKSLPSDLFKAEELSQLIIYSNKIEEIPLNISSRQQLKVFTIHDNPIKNIPEEIYTQGIDAINSYFLSLKSGPSDYLYEAKLIVVGNGTVGKTTLIENLKNSSYGTNKHSSTKGLEIRSWDLPVDNLKDTQYVKINIWDFGGQGKYRDIQQFFCTPNSFYLFVTEPFTPDKLKDDKYIDFYWLSFISALGKNNETQKQSPVVYVMNKCDRPGEKDVDRRSFKRQFNNIAEFVEVSCKRSKGIETLKKSIACHLDKIGILGHKLNKNWLTVKSTLEKMRMDHYCIDIDTYDEICREHYLNEKDGKVLLNYLNAIGTILHFKKIGSLEHQIILNPEWVKNAAYNVLDYPEAIKNKGRFTRNDLKYIWSNYKKQDLYRLIELMKEFDLCYEIAEDNTYVMPALFSDTPPDNYAFDQSDPLEHYEYIFEPFIPAGILLRLIVHRHELLSPQKWYWKNGAVFETPDNTMAEVTEIWQENKIIMRLKGNNSIKLWLNLRSQLLSICEKLQKQKNLKELKIRETGIDNNPTNLSAILKNIEKVTNNQNNTIHIYGGHTQIAGTINNHQQAQLSNIFPNTNNAGYPTMEIKNATFNGGFQQFADIITNNHPNIQFDQNTNELLKFIFEHAESDAERSELGNSVAALSNENCDNATMEQEKQKVQSFFSRHQDGFYKWSASIGEKTLSSILSKVGLSFFDL